MDKTYKKGEYISALGVEGTVEHLGFRTTTIRTTDKSLVTIPNSKLADSPVTNFTKRFCSRIQITLSVTYDTSAIQLEKITKRIWDYIYENDNFESTTAQALTIVRVTELGDSGIDILCVYYTKSTKYADYMAAKEQSLIAFMKVIEEEGSSLAYPTQKIFIENKATHKK
jgi:MscS family membrane protein